MKFLFTILFFLFSLLADATEYFMSTTGSDAANGLTSSTPWQTLGKINSITVTAGDIINFKRGDTWSGVMLNLFGYGAAGNPIIVRPYGTGAKPIITQRVAIPGWNTSGNWVDQGGNIWMWENIPNARDKTWRIWLNGIEYARAETGAAVTSVKRTSHSRNTFDLYVYATSNPATFYSSIEFPGDVQCTWLIQSMSYVTIENMDIRGGMSATIDIDFSSNITIQDCNVGWDAGGIGIRSTGTCNNDTIRRNTIDSGDRLIDDFEVSHSVLDGVWMTGGCNNWSIYHNTIKDWGHSNIELANLTTTPMTNILVYENHVSAPDVDYCRGTACNSLFDNADTGIKFYRNLFTDHPTRTQLNIRGMEFSYNIVNNTTNSPVRSEGIGQGIDISGYSNTDPRDIKVYNNVIANSDEEGISLRGGAGTYNDATGNLIRNNILYNNGKNSKNGFNGYQIVIGDDVDVLNNTFQNNLLYKSGVTDLIYYGHSATNDYPHTVAEFNAETGTAGDVVTANITGDPLFINSASNFFLQAGSPAIRAGMDLTAAYSAALVNNSAWPLGVGAGGQLAVWDVGAYLYNVGSMIIKRIVTQ